MGSALFRVFTWVAGGVSAGLTSEVARSASKVIVSAGAITATIALITSLVPRATIETAPEWIPALEVYIFPAVKALQGIPIISVLMEILLWALIFEASFMLAKLIMRIAEWVGLTGRGVYEQL